MIVLLLISVLSVLLGYYSFEKNTPYIEHCNTTIIGLSQLLSISSIIFIFLSLLFILFEYVLDNLFEEDIKSVINYVLNKTAKLIYLILIVIIYVLFSFHINDLKKCSSLGKLINFYWWIITIILIVFLVWFIIVNIIFNWILAKKREERRKEEHKKNL